MRYKKRGTPGEAVADAVHDRLQELIRGSRYGEREVAGAVDRSLSWRRDRRLASRMEVGYLIDLVDFLGEDRLEFFTEVLSGLEGPLLPRPRGAKPKVLQSVERRLAGEFGPRRPRSAVPLLTRLERLRYEDPKRAVQRAQRAVRTVELESLPGLLGVLGSAWRMQGRLDWAEHVIYRGWQLASEWEDRRSTARLVQRMGYVRAGRGEFVRALRFAEVATLQFLRLGELGEMAKGLVDQGIFLNNLGDHEEAIGAYDAALSFLPEDETRSRVSAISNKARSCRDAGRLREAHEAACLALEQAAELEPSLRAKILWLRASILLELGELDRVAEMLIEVRDVLSSVNPLDCALATLHLVRFYIVRQQPRRALEVAGSMPALIQGLKQNRIALAAVAEMLRDGIEGLTLAAVEKVEKELRRVGPKNPHAERPVWAFLRE